MKTEFEIFEVPATGVPVAVQDCEDLKDAVSASLRWAINEPGNCLFVPCAEHFETNIRIRVLLSQHKATEKMSEVRKEQEESEWLPTHEEIEKKAYELYKHGGKEGTAIDYWLIAEAQLKAEHAKGASAFLKTKASLRRNNG